MLLLLLLPPRPAAPLVLPLSSPPPAPRKAPRARPRGAARWPGGRRARLVMATTPPAPLPLPLLPRRSRSRAGAARPRAGSRRAAAGCASRAPCCCCRRRCCRRCCSPPQRTPPTCGSTCSGAGAFAGGGGGGGGRRAGRGTAARGGRSESCRGRELLSTSTLLLLFSSLPSTTWARRSWSARALSVLGRCGGRTARCVFQSARQVRPARAAAAALLFSARLGVGALQKQTPLLAELDPAITVAWQPRQAANSTSTGLIPITSPPPRRACGAAQRRKEEGSGACPTRPAHSLDTHNGQEE